MVKSVSGEPTPLMPNALMTFLASTWLALTPELEQRTRQRQDHEQHALRYPDLPLLWHTFVTVTKCFCNIWNAIIAYSLRVFMT